MALLIKKTIKDPVTGSEIYIEGTEAEVEVYERKLQKKHATQEAQKKKKDILLGRMTDEELRKIIRDEISRQPARVVHHHHDWVRTNGWWWRPYWSPSGFIYQYTQRDPNVYLSDVYCTYNSAAEMATHLGLADANHLLAVTNEDTSYDLIGSNATLSSDAITLTSAPTWTVGNFKT